MIIVKIAEIFVIFLFLIGKLWALNITPDYIKVGITEKEEIRTFSINLISNTDSVEILGIINQCGLDLKLYEKNLLQNKKYFGELYFNSGTRPGRFIEYVKIVYRDNEGIKEKKITVNWYNKSEYYSKTIVFNKTIDLGSLPKYNSSIFLLEFLNFGVSEGEINVRGISGINLNKKITIPPSQNIFLEVPFIPSEESKTLKIFIDKGSITQEDKYIDVKYRISNGVSIRSTKPIKDNNSYAMMLVFEDVNRFLQIVSIKDIDGFSMEYDKSFIPRGGGVLKVKIPEEMYKKVIENGLFINTRFLLN